MSSLFVLLFVSGVLVLAFLFLLLVGRKKPQRVYKPKGNFLLSAGEKRFFDALTVALQENPYLIFAKIRIADIIETRLASTDPNYWSYQSKINQKHIDFLLVNRLDTAPLLAIELDGGSHADKLREARDRFVDSVFQNAGIPMLHIPVKHFYSYVDLRQSIEHALRSTAPQVKERIPVAMS